MGSGVSFTKQEKAVLSEVMSQAWARKRGTKRASKRMYVSNPKRRNK